MKHCPACNFRFPDFHRVCDFDGTELISDPDRRSIDVVPRQSRARHSLKSAKFLTAIAVLALFAVSAFIVYLAFPSQTVPLVKTQPWPGSVGVRPADQTEAQPRIRTDSSVDANTQSRLAKAVVPTRQPNARLHKRAVARNKPSEPQIAQRIDDQSNDEDKDPKLLAVLKTTWRVLKKPFRF